VIWYCYRQQTRTSSERGGRDLNNQLDLFTPEDREPPSKPAGDRPVKMRVLVTVKAAPNPSEKYGETVCVAGLRIDPDATGWVRLYPINFRDLESDSAFRKYSVVRLEALPARQDSRRESWRPLMDSLKIEADISPVDGWRKRASWLAPHVENSMCRIVAGTRESHSAQSLALVRPREVKGLDIEPHPGWSDAERRKLEAYSNQPELFDQERTNRSPLEAPRFRAYYRYTCGELTCRGHRQGLLDWELVALQRNLRGFSDVQAIEQIQAKFLGQMFAARKDPAFYVGNQAKWAQTFSVLGVFYPDRRV
jgi:hypothetical protein